MQPDSLRQSLIFLAPHSSLRAARSAFTLFELIVAIALSATLLVLIGSSINLYLLRVDASRTEVEQSQLARNVLAMIAADIRATNVYQTQDISAIAQLAASTASFDVSSIDSAGAFKGSALNAMGAVGALKTAGTTGTLKTSTSKSSSSNGSSSSTNGSAASGSDNSNGNSESPADTVPGLNGSLNELVLDVNRLPRTEELFPPGQRPTATSSSSSSTSAAARPTDVKTVHYFVRQGSAVDPSDIAATSLAGADQQQAGGLVRQTIDQAVRTMAEQGGSSDVLSAGQVLVAPEVVRLEFQYFNGSEAVDSWSMQEQSAMPTAVEVRIWLAPNGTGSPAPSYSSSSPPTGSQMYSETIDLPLAAATGTPASTSSGDASNNSSASGSSATTGSNAGSGNAANKSTGK
jgi:Tfp pilus assembly protein PilE